MTSFFQNMLYRLPVECREHWRWRNGAAAGTARVFYGFDRLPPAQVMSGGLVKVLDLQTVFPNQPQGANILYLISSALPLLADCMARQARVAGAKVVLNQNGVAYPGWYGTGWQHVNRPMRNVLSLADHVVYQSRFCREAADRFLGPRLGPSEVLHNPVDTTVFVPAASDPAPGKFVILLAGSHGAFYRVKTAVDTLAMLLPRLPEARLVIAGRYAWRPNATDAQAELSAYAAQCGVAAALEIQGPYPQTSAVALLQRAHVLLHTKYNDPCPRLVVEAQACGLAVVYSATGGVPELVGGAAGVGVPGPLDFERDHPPAPTALAAALYTVAQQRTAFAVAAREHAVAHLDVKPWLCRHAAIFDALLANQRTGSQAR